MAIESFRRLVIREDFRSIKPQQRFEHETNIAPSVATVCEVYLESIVNKCRRLIAPAPHTFNQVQFPFIYLKRNELVGNFF